MSREEEPKTPKGRTGSGGETAPESADFVAFDELDDLDSEDAETPSEQPSELDDEQIRSAEAERRALPEPSELPDDDVPDSLVRPTRVIAVTGARGGAGRTVISSNLALYLATIGRKVVVVDADPSGANLHTCLGMRRPISLARVSRLNVRRDATTLIEEVMVRTAYPGLRLLYAGFDEPGREPVEECGDRRAVVRRGDRLVAGAAVGDPQPRVRQTNPFDPPRERPPEGRVRREDGELDARRAAVDRKKSRPRHRPHCRRHCGRVRGNRRGSGTRGRAPRRARPRARTARLKGAL